MSSRGYTDGGPSASLALQAVSSRGVGSSNMTTQDAGARLQANRGLSYLLLLQDWAARGFTAAGYPGNGLYG